MKFYERMRLLRNEKHLSQSTVAEYLHVGQRTYSDYENGRTRIPVESLIQLAYLYNVSMNYISYLQGYHKNKPPQQRTAFFLPT